MQNQYKKSGHLAPLDTSRMERVPPYNLEAEESVLGSMLISREAIMKVFEILMKKTFTEKQTRRYLNR